MFLLSLAHLSQNQKLLIPSKNMQEDTPGLPDEYDGCIRQAGQPFMCMCSDYLDISTHEQMGVGHVNPSGG